MKISLFKIGIILSVIGIIWTSVIFVESEQNFRRIYLKSQQISQNQIDFEGEGIGYYKILMPEFLKYEIFVQDFR